VTPASKRAPNSSGEHHQAAARTTQHQQCRHRQRATGKRSSAQRSPTNSQLSTAPPRTNAHPHSTANDWDAAVWTTLPGQACSAEDAWRGVSSLWNRAVVQRAHRCPERTPSSSVSTFVQSDHRCLERTPSSSVSTFVQSEHRCLERARRRRRVRVHVRRNVSASTPEETRSRPFRQQPLRVDSGSSPSASIPAAARSRACQQRRCEAAQRRPQQRWWVPRRQCGRASLSMSSLNMSRLKSRMRSASPAWACQIAGADALVEHVPRRQRHQMALHDPQAQQVEADAQRDGERQRGERALVRGQARQRQAQACGSMRTRTHASVRVRVFARVSVHVRVCACACKCRVRAHNSSCGSP